jgi:hypothetical protein
MISSFLDTGYLGLLRVVLHPAQICKKPRFGVVGFLRFYILHYNNFLLPGETLPGDPAIMWLGLSLLLSQPGGHG